MNSNEEEHKYLQLSDEYASIETSSINKLTLDEVFELAGGMGLYQWGVFALVGILSVFSAEAISMNFIGGSQDHWCMIPALANISHEQQKFIAVPTDSDGAYEKCLMYQLDYSQYTLEDFLNWNRSVEIGSETTECNHGWVFDQSTYVNTIASRLDLVCHRSGLVPLISTLFMAGTFVGSIASGILSDKYGRKKTLYAFVILKLVTGLLNAYPFNYAWLATTRLLMGVANASVYLISFVYVLELCTTKMRAIVGVMGAIDFSLGFMLWPVLAYYIRDDFLLQLAGTLPLLVAISFWWLLDESPRWLSLNGRSEEAEEVMRRISVINNSPFPEDFVFDVASHQKENVPTIDDNKKTVLDLVKSPLMLKQSLILVIFRLTDGLMYYALSLNTESLSGSVYVNTVISGVVEIPANIAAIFLLRWRVTGRRLTCSLSMIIAGLASIVSIYMILRGYGLANTIFNMVAKCFVTIAFNSIFIYTAELFPTEVRCIGAGVASSLSKMGSMAAPFFGKLLSVWPALPSVIYGSMALLSGLLILILPETRGRPLINTIKEADAR
ncbi:hypothetical protein CAPTEDRAFT_92879 [Capitella teleta]|uniref:Major facilitator superfamily (MFS) profile domain-containing protein n=1 Tax=Capitella teleta TaxID=283909 RepID=R7VAJ7_CAPTE|nr:hypothetical protein CAPTEDRAFT_92879 [Capitella teleta]|eukprot:ELU15629.1 hypothetical protein CAPTEDRAFT_92879 [Capitella teleta]